MDEDIEFLRDFLECDRYRIAELINILGYAMSKLGYLLRQHTVGPITLVYRDENDPMYELIQLLDGNNFEVEYGCTLMGMEAAKIYPLYIETIKVQYEPEVEVQSYSMTTTYTEYATEYVPDIPEVRNPSRRGLRAKALLIDDILFSEKLFDEFLKPPQRRKE